jgi:hypothetical protein
MKKLYKFFWDCGRIGAIDGLFIADEQTIENAIGKQVYFGEILGIYSEVYGELKAKDLRCMSDDQNLIKALELVFDSDGLSGYNPLCYLEVEEEWLDEEE